MLLAQGVADQLDRARVVPPGDEARGADRDEGRRARRARAVQRPSGRRRDEPQGVVPRRSRAAAHAARRRRLRPRRSAHDVRAHRREGLDLQGRHPPVQERGRGQDRPRGRDGRRRDRRSARCAPGRQRGWRSPAQGRRGEPVVATAARPKPPKAARTSRPSRCSARPTPSSSVCSRKKKRSSGAPASTTRPRTSAAARSRSVTHVDAPQGPAPQGATRAALTGMAKGGHAPRVRRVRHPGARAGLADEPADRSRSYRDDPSHQAWREGLDQRLPRQADHPEARGDADGFGQGQPREVGCGREAGSGAVRAVGCSRDRSPARRCGSRSTSSRCRRASSCARKRGRR